MKFLKIFILIIALAGFTSTANALTQEDVNLLIDNQIIKENSAEENIARSIASATIILPASSNILASSQYEAGYRDYSLGQFNSTGSDYDSGYSDASMNSTGYTTGGDDYGASSYQDVSNTSYTDTTPYVEPPTFTDNLGSGSNSQESTEAYLERIFRDNEIDTSGFDVCKNIAGIQISPPSGYKEINKICTINSSPSVLSIPTTISTPGPVNPNPTTNTNLYSLDSISPSQGGFKEKITLAGKFRPNNQVIITHLNTGASRNLSNVKSTGGGTSIKFSFPTDKQLFAPGTRGETGGYSIVVKGGGESSAPVLFTVENTATPTVSQGANPRIAPTPPVTAPPADQCINMTGYQYPVPTGFVRDSNGVCTLEAPIISKQLNLTITPEKVFSGSEVVIKFEDILANYYILSASCKDSVYTEGKARPDLCMEGEKIFPTGKDTIRVDDFVFSSKAKTNSGIFVELNAFNSNDQVIQSDSQYVDIFPKSETTKPLKILTPNGGERWEFPSEHSITWTSSNDPHGDSDSVVAYVEKKVGRNFIELGKAIKYAKGSIIWDGGVEPDGKPSFMIQKGIYFIRLVDAVTGETDRSDKAFTVVPNNSVVKADLKVRNLKGKFVDGDASNQVVVKGDKVEIRWTSKQSKTCEIHHGRLLGEIEKVGPRGRMELSISDADLKYGESQVVLICFSDKFGGNYGNDYISLKLDDYKGSDVSASVISVEKDGGLYVNGEALGTNTVGLAISDSGGKVYGSGDINVANGKWSHFIDTDFQDGTYTVVLYVNNVEMDRYYFEINRSRPLSVIAEGLSSSFSSKYIYGDGSSNNSERGYFTMKVEVTAVGGDVWIQDLVNNNAGQKSGFIYTIIGDVYNGITSAFIKSETSNTKVNNYHKINEGSSETFTLEFQLDPNQTGNYGVELKGVRFSTDSSGTNTSVLDVSGIESDLEFING